MTQKTLLNDTHRALGAKMVDFGGWDMPIHYGSQIEEHHRVRRDAGMFDVSHMTVVDLRGAQVRPFLRQLVANSVDKLLKPGKALYTCMLNAQGGVIDDLIVYYLSEDWFRLVVNAATRDKDLAWIAAQAVEQREILLTELLAENQRLQDSLPARVAGGTAQAGDLLVAQQEALTLTDRRDDLQRDRAKARAALRRWVGSRADEALQGDPGPLTRPVAQLRTELANHAELELYPAMQSMARAESREAQSETRGDWAWEIAYSRRDRRWGDMVSFQVTFDLPWQKDRRQVPMIEAKRHELERLDAEREDVARRHLQELDDSAAELQALNSQIDRLQTAGLQLVRNRAALALSNYRSAKGDLSAVLSARAQVLETRMRLIDLGAQRDSLVARLNSLIAD